MKSKLERTLSEARFRELIESYGADPIRWPSDERDAAMTFMTTCPQAKAWLAEQARIDSLLNGIEDVEPSVALTRRVAEIPVREGQSDRVGGSHSILASVEQGTWWPFLRLRNLLVAGLAACALGVVTGGVSRPDRSEGADAQASWDDWCSVALGGEWSEELSP